MMVSLTLGPEGTVATVSRSRLSSVLVLGLLNTVVAILSMPKKAEIEES